MEYIEREVRSGLSLEDAIGRADVLERAVQFKDELLNALSEPEVQDKLMKVIRELMQ